MCTLVMGVAMLAYDGLVDLFPSPLDLAAFFTCKKNVEAHFLQHANKLQSGDCEADRVIHMKSQRWLYICPCLTLTNPELTFVSCSSCYSEHNHSASNTDNEQEHPHSSHTHTYTYSLTSVLSG